MKDAKENILEKSKFKIPETKMFEDLGAGWGWGMRDLCSYVKLVWENSWRLTGIEIGNEINIIL